MIHSAAMCRRFLFVVVCFCLTGVGLDPIRRLRADDAKPDPKVAAVLEAMRREVECRWAHGEIAIDGQPSEEDWKTAPVISHFGLPWLAEGQRLPQTATKARLLWDRDHLYFFAEMVDTDLYADVEKHDGQTWYNDVFELFFKPAENKPGYYEFQVNAAGTVMDMFIPQRGSGGFQRFIGDGEFHIDAKVALNGTLNKWSDKDTGWSVEGRIPWRDLIRTGGRPALDEKWKFALCRYDYSVDFEGPDLSTCAPLSSKSYPDFHAHEDYATLRFVGPKETPKNAATKPAAIDQFVALTTSRVIGSPDPPPPFRATRALAELDINFPIAVEHQPGSDQLIVIHQDRPYGTTVISRFKDVDGAKEMELLLKLESTAYGLTFHPQFAQNGFVYVGHNGPGAPRFDTKTSRISRYTMDVKDNFRFAADSEKIIIEWPSDGHNGAAITFGLDGMMYVTSGDGTSDSDTNLTGQGLDHLLAKVLRIDVDHVEGDAAYSVPRDNPFVGQENVRPETWAYGFRNPWKITTDRKQGHIWVGNNGQDLWEQAYLVERGANYGWSVYEGSHVFYANRTAGPTPISKPTVEHSHAESRSLTGGIVYYGQQFPELQGAYIYGDHSTGKIWAVKHDGKQITMHQEIADTPLNVAGFGVDSRGEILVCHHQSHALGGGLYRLEPNPDQKANLSFPKKLSESGLFADVKSHKLLPSLIPYSVNSPLWSDGTYKERYLGLPGQDTKINFTRRGSWEFPDDTVLVKSFALDVEEGNPASRRWIETRFLTRQQGEWAGYSYEWNDEQSDATLVDKQGLDRDFTIRTNGGERKQTWRYPSRTECMVCHSRAAKFVLGLSTMQLNKDHDYGHVVENQLAVFEHLGLFKTDWKSEMVDDLRETAKARGLTDEEASKHVDQITATRGQRGPSPASSLLAKSPALFERFVNPYDETADLNARARSYLHTNCSICHVEAGGGNAQIILDFATALDKMRLIDAKPLHHTFDINDARLVAAGDPDRSVLLHRVAIRGRGQMPQLATSIPDQQAINMLRAWIAQLKNKDSQEQ